MTAVQSLSFSLYNVLTKTKQSLRRFHRDERGVTSIEYALLAALIAVVVIGGATLIGTNVNTEFTTIAGKV